MKKILVIFGPNMRALGQREPELYGTLSYRMLTKYISRQGKLLKLRTVFFQSDCEGCIVKKIIRSKSFDAYIINAAAYTHTSVAILDALRAASVPTVEVHLTDTDLREEFRKLSYVSLYAKKTIKGLGKEGYREALEYLSTLLKD